MNHDLPLAGELAAALGSGCRGVGHAVGVERAAGRGRRRAGRDQGQVYGREPGTFGERDEYLLTMFAAQSAILVANVRTFENATKLSEALADALRGRDMISIAKGIVMAREYVDEGTAFAVLAKSAREENEKLRDLAGTLVRSTTRRDR